MTKNELVKYRKRRERILALLASGSTQAQVARLLKMKPQRVQQIYTQSKGTA